MMEMDNYRQIYMQILILLSTANWYEIGCRYIYKEINFPTIRISCFFVTHN